MMRWEATRVEMTHYEWDMEGARRFGENRLMWRFVCPACGHEASLLDWWRAGARFKEAASSCIGNRKFRVPFFHEGLQVDIPESSQCEHAEDRGAGNPISLCPTGQGRGRVDLFRFAGPMYGAVAHTRWGREIVERETLKELYELFSWTDMTLRVHGVEITGALAADDDGEVKFHADSGSNASRVVWNRNPVLDVRGRRIVDAPGDGAEVGPAETTP